MVCLLCLFLGIRIAFFVTRGTKSNISLWLTRPNCIELPSVILKDWLHSSACRPWPWWLLHGIVIDLAGGSRSTPHPPFCRRHYQIYLREWKWLYLHQSQHQFIRWAMLDQLDQFLSAYVHHEDTLFLKIRSTLNMNTLTNVKWKAWEIFRLDSFFWWVHR